jgi:hypothetical protein
LRSDEGPLQTLFKDHPITDAAPDLTQLQMGGPDGQHRLDHRNGSPERRVHLPAVAGQRTAGVDDFQTAPFSSASVWTTCGLRFGWKVATWAPTFSCLEHFVQGINIL